MGIKILLADDSVTAQNMGKKILSEAGHEVITVSNGAAAAKKIAEVKPELVLLDVFMPGYSGLELCEKLRNAPETSKMPVLLTVGRMEPYSAQDGARVKADGVIIKPFEATDLTAAVDRLAEKTKSGKQASSERTANITHSVAGKEEKPRDTQELPAYDSSAPQKGYEQTIRLDAAQIAAMLNSTTAAKTEKPTTTSAPDQPYRGATAAFPDEFQIGTRPSAEIPASDANVPVFGTELTPEAHVVEPRPSAVPSYMAQYLSVEPTPAESPAPSYAANFDARNSAVTSTAPQAAPEIAAVPPPPQQLSPTISISDELLVQRFESDVAGEPPVASAEGLELTAAAPVPDVPIIREPGFEATLQSSDAPTLLIKDPALVTDRHRATADFPTQFGTTDATASEIPADSGSVAASVDDFEARLNAAMSNYDLPSADTPLSTQETASPDLRAELFGELASPAVESLEVITDPVGSLELPSGSFIGAAIEYSESAAATPEPPIADIVEQTRSNVIEFHSRATEAAELREAALEAIPDPGLNFGTSSGAAPEAFSLPPVAAEQPSPEEPQDLQAASKPIVSRSVEAAPAPETDETVIARIRQAFSGLPADHSHAHAESAEPAPLAMAAAAAASAASTPSQFGHHAELEIARALAAAVDSEVLPEPIVSAAAEADETAFGRDANNLAAAVERVMKRELPTLIWKIMAELDLRKR